MGHLPETFFQWVVFLLQQYGGVLLKGAGVTLLLAIIGTLAGCVIGLVVGVLQTMPTEEDDGLVKRICMKVLKKLLSAYVEIFRGTYDCAGNGGLLRRHEPFRD